LEKIHIDSYPAIPTLTEMINHLQQLINQNNSFREKLYNENLGARNVARSYYNCGKDKNRFQSGYLEVIKTIESTSKEGQGFWNNFSQSPVMSRCFPKIETRKSFGDLFAAMFNKIISLNKNCNCPIPWRYHQGMIQLLENFASF